MQVYYPLMKYLDECGLQTVTLTYSEIEKIIDRELPVTAYKRTQWWANNKIRHSQAAAWLDVGYKTCDIILAESVTFEMVH